MIHLVLAAVIALSAPQIRVVDGDTIEVAGESWRLKGYDTPETRYAKCARERMLGLIATASLKAAIAQAARIEIAPAKGRDRYRRRLGVLLIDGKDAAAVMIAEGLARPYKRGRRQSWCTPRWVAE